jgi:hypothetical protein
VPVVRVVEERNGWECGAGEMVMLLRQDGSLRRLDQHCLSEL